MWFIPFQLLLVFLFLISHQTLPSPLHWEISSLGAKMIVAFVLCHGYDFSLVGNMYSKELEYLLLSLSRKKGFWYTHLSSSTHFSCDPIICHLLLYSLFPLIDSVISFLYFRQWLEDALRENEPDSSFIFLVGTKKDLVVSKLSADKEIRFSLVPQVISLAKLCTMSLR